MKKLLTLSAVLLSALISFAQKPDYIRTQNGPNTIVDWNLKAKTFVLPHGPTVGLYGSQDTTGNVYFRAASGDTSLNIRVGGVKWWSTNQFATTTGLAAYKLNSDSVNAQGYVRNWKLTNLLSGYVPATRSVLNGYGIVGGSQLNVDITKSVDTTVIKSKASALADYNVLMSGKQPLNAKLTAIGALANANGVLTNNGSGTFGYTTPYSGRTSQPAYLEQFIGGFFGRGMLTDETINITTEQFITGSAVVGDDVIAVTSNTNFQVGGLVTVKHDNGLYGTYFITAKSGSTNIGIQPHLRYPVSSGVAKIERTWFNRAHPGKYYMRELAQRIARSTEVEASMPVTRMLFTNFSASAPTAIDTLVSINGATINYFAASNTGATSADPVRFPIGRTAMIDYDAAGEGAETRLIDLQNSQQAVASVALSSNSSSGSAIIQVINEYGNLIAVDTVKQNTTKGIFQIYKIPFLTVNSKQIKVRVTAGNSGGSLYIGQIDVYESPVNNGKIIAKNNAVIVGLGDSWFSGDTVSTPERESILTQLALELPYATVINKGVGGNTVVDLNNRFETDVAPYNPDYVIVNTGTNEAYNPLSATFDPNAIDAFILSYNSLIGKILAIGARPIMIGVPALAQSDADVPSLGEWELNDRARLYQRYFYERLATKIDIVQNNLTASTVIAPSKTAVNTALSYKANIASPAFTGTVTIPSGAALGTPASIDLTNATGSPAALNIGGTSAKATTLQTTASTSDGTIAYHPTYGLLMKGKAGSDSDVSIFTPAGNEIMTNPTGTQNVKFWGGVNLSALTAERLAYIDVNKNLVVTTALPSGTTASTPSASADVANKAYVDGVNTSGGLAKSIRNITSSTTITNDDYTIWITGGGTFSQALPATPNTGQIYYFVNNGVGTITLTATSIMGAGSLIISAGQTGRVQYTGTSGTYVIL